MTRYFFDSSALIKRYIPEHGTRWVRGVISRHSINTILIAQITPIEVVSGLSRREREGFLSKDNAARARRLMERHIGQPYVTIDLSYRVMSLAKDLLGKHPLRAYDSVQLASALHSNREFVAVGLPMITFVSSDTRLLEIAAIEGLPTDDPNAHP